LAVTHARTWHSRCTARVQPVSKLKLILVPPSWLALVALVLFCACAEIPKQRYGVDRLKFTGMKELDTNAMRACIATEEREKITLGLGALIGGSCGEPPFDKTRWATRLFALPWTEWPVYDEAVLKLDLDRVERWYQARGFYGVRIIEVKFSPDAARTSDACHGKDCAVEITVKLEEGEPVRLRKINVVVEGEIDPKVRKKLDKALGFEKGDIFDEAHYDVANTELARVLREAGYARVEINGDIEINRGLLVADVTYNIKPGPLCHFGPIRLTSKGKIPEGPVRAVTLLRPGQVYDEDELEDAQRAIYALGAFSSVTVRGELEDSEGPEIPIVIELEPRRESQVLVGAGIMSGTTTSGNAALESISIPQWDVHLIGSYDNRNFFGGLRRFRIEERPRMLFLDAFPAVPDNSPRFGNVITADFSQPGVIDARTSLFVETRWDNGPDPFLLFFRNDIGVAIGLERAFFKQRLIGRIGLHQEIMQVSRRQPIVEDVRRRLEYGKDTKDGERGTGGWNAEYDNMAEPRSPVQIRDDQAAFYELPSSYRLPYIEQRLSLDLRDDVAKPTKGAYFRVVAHEAIQFGKDTNIGQYSWNYIRLTPEARGYVPVGLGMVLAGRFALGWLGVLDAGQKLDGQSKQLGPQAYRLRGGGAMSNRGFGPGELGDGRTGGTHRWEASLELRVPLSKDFYLVGFGDMGDVNAGFDIQRSYDGMRPEGERFESRLVQRKDQNFRFQNLNTAVGGGLRYYTVIGPVRLDVGVRPKALAGKSDDDYRMDLGITKFRGAVHLTIGDAF
jgi:outer membrane protein assembly factor BamA